jgi:hypothetical protein
VTGRLANAMRVGRRVIGTHGAIFKDGPGENIGTQGNQVIMVIKLLAGVKSVNRNDI